jgi:RNA polymerase primary sigma factor
MIQKNDENSVFRYLGEIYSGPLLTKKEEEELVRNIEVYQKQIIDGCLKSPYSRLELLSYIRNLLNSGENIIDISKKLDDESDPKLIKHVEQKFVELVEALSKNELEHVQSLLNEVSLSGTIIHGVVTEIKKKYSKVHEAENKLNQIKKWFSDRPFDSIIDIISKIRSNEEVRFQLRKELRLTELQMMNKCGEWENGIKEYEEVKNSFPKEITFEDVKTLHKEVNTLEFHMKKFKNTLIEKNLRLVVARAKKLRNKGLEFEDLIQEGNIGLMKAIDKYDISKKTKVATYATWWIDQSIRRAISNKGKTVRIPTHIEFLQTNLNQLIQKMTGELKRPPTLREISERSGHDLETLEKLETRALHEVGLEDTMSSGLSLIEVLPSDPNGNPHALTEAKILKEKIREILSTLSPRNEKIIRLRFGIGEIPVELENMDNDEKEEGLTLQVIGDHVGITKQGVRQVEISSMRKMKKKLEKFSDEFDR